MYVEALIGRDTVDTIPPATMDAFRDHGEAIPDAIEQDVDGRPRDARRRWSSTASRSKEITDRAGRGRACSNSPMRSTSCSAPSPAAPHATRGRRAGFDIEPGSPTMKAACDAEMEAWRKDGRIRRLWAGDNRCGPGRTRTNGSAGSIVEQELADVAGCTALPRR